MTKLLDFPVPLRFLSTISGGKDRPYIIGAMFSAAYADKAKRLAASCEKFALPYVIHEVPTVHRSISLRGADDPAYTKPNFISKFARNIQEVGGKLMPIGPAGQCFWVTRGED